MLFIVRAKHHIPPPSCINLMYERHKHWVLNSGISLSERRKHRCRLNAIHESPNYSTSSLYQISPRHQRCYSLSELNFACRHPVCDSLMHQMPTINQTMQRESGALSREPLFKALESGGDIRNCANEVPLYTNVHNSNINISAVKRKQIDGGTWV